MEKGQLHRSLHFCRQNNTGLLLTDNFVVMDMRTCGGVRLYLVNETNDVIWRLSFNLYTTYRNFYIYPCNCTSNSLPSRWAFESLLVLTEIKRVLLAVAQRLSQQWCMLIRVCVSHWSWFINLAQNHGIRKRSDWKEKNKMMMMKKKNNEHPKRAIAGSNYCNQLIPESDVNTCVVCTVRKKKKVNGLQKVKKHLFPVWGDTLGDRALLVSPIVSTQATQMFSCCSLFTVIRLTRLSPWLLDHKLTMRSPALCYSK